MNAQEKFEILSMLYRLAIVDVRPERIKAENDGDKQALTNIKKVHDAILVLANYLK